MPRKAKKGTPERQRLLIEFRWDGDDDPLDYLSVGSLTDKEADEVRALLAQAEAQNRIGPGWYVGPLGKSQQSGRKFLEELERDLALDKDA